MLVLMIQELSTFLCKIIFYFPQVMLTIDAVLVEKRSASFAPQLHDSMEATRIYMCQEISDDQHSTI